MLDFHSVPCKDEKKACLECGHTGIPRILYLGEHCFCTECATALGIWEGEVDRERVERLDEMMLVLQEGQDEMKAVPHWRRKRICPPPKACYAGPWG